MEVEPVQTVPLPFDTDAHGDANGETNDRSAASLARDLRASRGPRPSSTLHAHDAGHATVELASIMIPASNPVSPGPSSPPLDQTRAPDFVPPTRPSSTPFPQFEHRGDDVVDADKVVYGETGCQDSTADAVGAAGAAGKAAPAAAAASETSADTGLPEAYYATVADEMDVDSIGDEEDEEDEADEADDRLASSSMTDFNAPAADASATARYYRPTTPCLSPISTLATTAALDSPGSHYESCFEDLPVYDCNGQRMSSLSPPPPPPLPPAPASLPRQQALFLHHLPMEIQALILDHLFDCRVSPMLKSSPDKRLTKLAVVSPVWRALIQKRLYCHLKLKATGATLSEATVHFAKHPHLRSYVKHVELWFSVFQPKSRPPALSAATPAVRTMTQDGVASGAYVLPSDNCALEEAFDFVRTTFPDVTVLTLEGGERKKAPQVRHFVRGPGDVMRGAVSGAVSSTADPPPAISPIATVRTLVVKGQWNLIRSDGDFRNIAAALPQMQAWHASYSKPKSKSYLSMATILPNLPANLTTLDLCLEGDYRQEISFPTHFLKVFNQTHFCLRLASATPALQHLSYTGRVCHTFFDVVACLADPRTTRLKSIDLTVKNCCRAVNHWHESGSGITDINFIRAFEALVLAGVRSMARLTQLEHLRIRYVDLEFPIPPLNPFFLMHNGWASGVWSDTIVAELNRVRPRIRWEELSETFGEMAVNKDGRMVLNPEFPKKRVVSLKLSNYAFFVALATM
ncbi:hypothetical protein SPI_08494 [Niveomyces insectorum RCEF 264]|uniref:Uncharacterized protein n=1 Tax=Niveomyces insectorum RCEF 264 TaxID=1081102 RepID=A0A162ME85_9HYPO|nr:hypothetical protein SPI_08494 [Niveomyces insectorum RCEF 264]